MIMIIILTTKYVKKKSCKQVYRRRHESRRASKAQTALRKQKNKIWRRTIFNMADGIPTPCNVARSWHWFRQVTAPCNVACGSGIMTVNSTSGMKPLSLSRAATQKHLLYSFTRFQTPEFLHSSDLGSSAVRQWPRNMAADVMLVT